MLPVNSNACLLFDLCMLAAILFGEKRSKVRSSRLCGTCGWMTGGEESLFAKRSHI